MVFRRRASAQVETAPAALTVQSRLLPNIFAGLETREEKLTVLDLGPGRANTLNYFAGLPCSTQVIFADCDEIITELNAAQQADEDFAFPDVMHLFQQHLGLQPETQLDIVLLWDYLHKFDLSTVEALSTVLQPHLHNRSRGYGFGCLHSDQPIAQSHYEITPELGITIARQAGATLPYAHSQQVLNEFFMCMRITKGTLLQEGHLELLLEAFAV